jgi:glycosyltransferase involved in cell wall biosynthesis
MKKWFYTKSKRRSVKCALLLSTYNRPDALTRCLESVLEQTVMPDRIIIADDGSGDETRLLVENFKAKIADNRCVHVWQPN